MAMAAGNLLKSVMQSGMSTAGNLLAAVASAKIYAVVLGPKYNAVAGVINNMVALCAALATAAGTSAFIQGAASRSGAERWRFIKTVTRFYATGALMISAILMVIAPWLAGRFFPESGEGSKVIMWCIPVILTGVFTGVCSGLLQVEQRIATLGKITLAGALFGVGLAAVAAPLIARMGFWLVPVVQFGNQIFVLILMLAIGFRSGWGLEWKKAGAALSLRSLKGYWALTASALLAAVSFYASQLEVRTRANTTLGLEEAGAFAAAFAMCGMYVDLLLRSFSQVYLPRIAGNAEGDRSILVRQFFKIAVLFGLPLVLFTGIFRHYLLNLLFHSTYARAGYYVTWMLPGDILKMFSWLYGMVLIGAGDAARSMISDLVWCAGFVLISIVTLQNGFRFGPCLAFSVMYGVTLTFNAAMCRKHHGVTVTSKDFLLLAGMLAVVTMVAWLSS